jgi:hypothetical protein
VKIPFIVRAEEKLLQAGAVRARAEGISLSELFRVALGFYLKEISHQKAQRPVA